MPQGNNYPALVGAADLQKATQATAALETSLTFVPDMGPDVLTNATITPERLPLAEKALEVAHAAPNVLRKALDPQRLADKLTYYKALLTLRATLIKAEKKLANALNVLGSDILFDSNNIHEDVEKDKGETVDLGLLRTELAAFYAHPAARKPKPPKPPKP